MINKNGSRCNYTKPKFQQKRQKQKQKGTLSWESKSSIKLFYVQSHIPPHLQSSVHGSPSLLQEQRPEHLLFALHSPFVSSLHGLRYTRLRYPAWHENISLLAPSSFIWIWKVLHWYQRFVLSKQFLIHGSDNMLLQRNLGRGKFSSCRPYWAKICHLHLFTSCLVDAAWYIKQTNLSMAFSSLSITSAVGLLHSFTKLSVNCG